MGGTWALWYALARPGQRSSKARAARRVQPAVARHSCPATLASSGRIRSQGAAGALDQTQPEAGRSDDDLDGRGRTPSSTTRTRSRRSSRRAATRSSPGSTSPSSGSHLALRSSDVRCRCSQTSCGNSPCRRCPWYGEMRPHRSGQGRRGGRQTAPNAQLEVLHAGHAPWLGNPDRTAKLVSTFVVEFTGERCRVPRSAGSSRHTCSRDDYHEA